MLGAAALSRNQRLDLGTGGTWRWLLEEYKQGDYMSSIRDRFSIKQALDEGLASGTLVRDDRLFEYFRLRPGAEK